MIKKGENAVLVRHCATLGMRRTVVRKFDVSCDIGCLVSIQRKIRHLGMWV
jgi:hypothetical protein